MSIQRAEELKRQWTDKRVAVRSVVPELRRFEGLTGTVKTANMNCRLLIEFDGPADISWYDIDPQFVDAVVDEAPKAAAATEASASTESDVDSKADSDAAAQTPSKKSTGPGSPSGLSPLDQIRAAATAATTEETTAEASTPVSSAASLSPLDQIRQQAAGGSSAPKAGPGNSAANPLDAIRQQNLASNESPGTPAPTPPEKTAAAPQAPSSDSAKGQSPLDQIRAQNAAPAGSESESAADEKSESDQSSTSQDESPSSPAAAVSAERLPDPENVGMVGSDQNPMNQVSDQAGITASDSHFEQVRNQASEEEEDDDDDANEPRSGSEEPSAAAHTEMAGTEDPVKLTFRGRKLPRQNDLKIVEGIGPKIEELFNEQGISSWKTLSESAPEDLKKILEAAGSRFRMHNPETWPAQAKLANEGHWKELEEYQDHLQGGREPDAE